MAWRRISLIELMFVDSNMGAVNHGAVSRSCDNRRLARSLAEQVDLARTVDEPRNGRVGSPVVGDVRGRFASASADGQRTCWLWLIGASRIGIGLGRRRSRGAAAARLTARAVSAVPRRARLLLRVFILASSHRNNGDIIAASDTNHRTGTGAARLLRQSPCRGRTSPARSGRTDRCGRGRCGAGSATRRRRS